MAERVCKRCSGEVDAKRLARSDYRCRTCMNAEQNARRRAMPVPVNPRKSDDPAVLQRLREADARTYRRMYADPIGKAKHFARVAARNAVRRGRLTRQPCEVCGAAEVEAHHDDYSQPLNVRWLCRPHHRELHAAERRAA